MKTLRDFLERYDFDQTESLDPRGGSVYRGVDRETGAIWAIKWSETHPRFDRKLIPERCATAKNLDHDNLLPYANNFRFEDQTIVDVVVLPLMTERSLAQHTDLVDEDRRLIAEQVLDAIYYLHAQGQVWQYLAASHILLGRAFGNWIPKLIHYGNTQKVPLAYFSDWEYLAPEQLDEKRPIDARTDIWAYGVLLYECWTGRLPFGQKSASLTNAKLRARITGTEDWTLGLLPKIPMPYRMIAEKCLKRNPEERWDNCGQIIAALKEWQAQRTNPTTPAEEVSTEPTPIPRRFSERPSHRPIVWWQVVLFLLVAAFMGYWLGQLG